MSGDGRSCRSNVRRAAMLATVALVAGLFVTAPIVASTSTPAAALTPAAYEGAVRADNPISWWPLDETAGSIAADKTGPNQGFIQGGVTTGVPGPFGTGSTAFRFDGGACSGVDVGRDPASLATPR